MKAYLLAAGLGTRLRPLTDRTPKCLLPVGGEPLLGRWLRLCARHGVRDVLVNTHHLAEEVREYVAGPGRRCGPRVRLFHEERLLGSAGTVRAAREFASGEESFFVLYADNVTDVDLGRMAVWHAAHDDAMTAALFRAPRPERCGVAVVDGEGRIVEFAEKPAFPRSPWAAAGIYLARPCLFERLDEAWAARPPGREVLDFGFDVMPLMAARGGARGYLLREPLLDIGTPEAYAEARRRAAAGGGAGRVSGAGAGPRPRPDGGERREAGG